MWTQASVNHESGGGFCAPFRGELGSHPTQSGLAQGLPQYQVASDSSTPQYTNVTDRQAIGPIALWRTVVQTVDQKPLVRESPPRCCIGNCLPLLAAVDRVS